MNHSQSRRCLAQSLLCLCHIPRSSESCSSHHQQLHINASAPDCIPVLSAYERFLLCNHWQPYGLQPNTFLRCLLSRYGSPVQSIECPDGCGVQKNFTQLTARWPHPCFCFAAYSSESPAGIWIFLRLGWWTTCTQKAAMMSTKAMRRSLRRGILMHFSKFMCLI